MPAPVQDSLEMTTDNSPSNRVGPATAGIDHVETIVSSHEAAAAWYERVLGLEIQSEYEQWATDGGPLILSGDGGGTKLALFEGTPARDRADEPTGFQRVAFGVDGNAFERFLERLPELELTDGNGEPVRAADVVDHDLSHSIYFTDLDGNPLEVTTYDPVDG